MHSLNYVNAKIFTNEKYLSFKVGTFFVSSMQYPNSN